MDLNLDQDLFWVAREGLMASVLININIFWILKIAYFHNRLRFRKIGNLVKQKILRISITSILPLGKVLGITLVMGITKGYTRRRKRKRSFRKRYRSSYSVFIPSLTMNNLLLSSKESNDEKRTKAKQDVEQLLGKSEKKKKKPKSDLNALSTPGKRGQSPIAIASLEKKPLPGIGGLVRIPCRYSMHFNIS